MKKVLLLVSAIVLAITLGGCDQNKTTDYSNQIIMGRVSLVEGTKITVELMLNKGDHMMNGPVVDGMDGMENVPPQDPGMPPQEPNGMPPQGQPGGMPPMRPEDNEFNSNGNQYPPMDMNDARNNRFDDKQNRQFNNLQTLTFDLNDVDVVFENEFAETNDEEIVDITVGMFIRIEFGDNNVIKTVSIQPINDIPPFEGPDEIPFEEDEVPFENAN